MQTFSLPLLNPLRGGPAMLLSALLLAGCASAPTPRQAPAVQAQAWPERLDQWRGAEVLLLGEQHDAAEHHAWEAQTVHHLAIQGRLAAVVIEMADAGTSTAGVPPNASEAEVQQALQWSDKAWPWASYGPAIMAAVRQGVPVHGGNIARSSMRDIMKDARFDSHLPQKAMQMQIDAIRKGHCDLLPESQLQPMARIQLARDESMAKTILSALQPDKTVVLVAGHGHVQEQVGVRTWLPRETRVQIAIAQAGEVSEAIKKEANIFILTPALPPRDHCAALREQFKR